MSDRETVAPEVNAVIADYFGTRCFTYVTSLRGRQCEGGLDADSLDLVKLAVAIEERFGVSVEDDEVDRVETVGDVIGLVDRKLGGRG